MLSATGSVYLINPSGVIIGKDGVVDLGGTFAASTLDVDDSAFLNGGSLTVSGAPTLASAGTPRPSPAGPTPSSASLGTLTSAIGSPSIRRHGADRHSGDGRRPSSRSSLPTGRTPTSSTARQAMTARAPDSFGRLLAARAATTSGSTPSGPDQGQGSPVNAPYPDNLSGWGDIRFESGSIQ